MRPLVFAVRYIVITINYSLFTIPLHSSVRTTHLSAQKIFGHFNDVASEFDYISVYPGRGIRMWPTTIIEQPEFSSKIIPIKREVTLHSF